MTRDEVVETLIGPGGDLNSPQEAPESFFDPYLSDAYRILGDDELMRTFATLHEGITLAHMGTAISVGEFLSSISPLDADPYRRRIWIPVTKGFVFEGENRPLSILGIKETISTEDDWLTGITYNAETGAVGGIVEEDITYWIPRALYPSPYLQQYFLGPMGLSNQDLPVITQDKIPSLIALTERYLQKGASFLAIQRLVHAWCGGDFISFPDEGEDLYDIVGTPLITIDSPNSKNREWETPIEITATNQSKGYFTLANNIPDSCVPLQDAKIRIINTAHSIYQGTSDDVIIKRASGKFVAIYGSAPPLLARTIFLQVLKSHPKSPDPLSITLDASLEVDDERIRRVIGIFLKNMNLSSWSMSYE